MRQNQEITVEHLLQSKPGFRFYRLLNDAENHRGFQYKTGINIDTNEFNPSGSCEKGGLYFFDESQLINYSEYTYNCVWIREVTFLPDSRIYCEKGKYKTDKFILSERQPFTCSNWHTFVNWKNQKIYLAAVKRSVML